MTNELKPCAHCAGEAIVHGDDSSFWKLCRVACPSCFTSGGNHMTRDGAIAAWNRRAPSEAVGLLRELATLWDRECLSNEDVGLAVVERGMDEKIRRFLAAQDKEST